MSYQGKTILFHELYNVKVTIYGPEMISITSYKAQNYS